MLPKTAHLMEVGPRDGLQIEPTLLSVEQKLELLDAIAAAGVREIEVGSFVNPKAVPPMANTEEVFQRMTRHPGVTYRGLWLNPRGLDRAVALGNVDPRRAAAAHRQRDLRQAQHQPQHRRHLRRHPRLDRPLPGRRRGAGLPGRDGGLRMQLRGRHPRAAGHRPDRAAEEMLVAAGSSLQHVSIADTMGWATPDRIRTMIVAVRARWPNLAIKLHLHDTRGTAMANAVAALELGVREFDGSIGGLGGCPFAGHKGAAGNICTEDLAYLCEEMGIDTGIDLPALIRAAQMAEEMLGHPLPGKVMKGGLLPRKPAA
jgi:hydroxymethylglutaryl-CoA lyase